MAYCFALLFTFIGLAFIGWALAGFLPSRRAAKSSINYTPRGDRVIVRRLPRPEPRPGDVFLPASQQAPLNEGTVIAVGPARELKDIRVGEHICFLDFAGTPVEIDGQDYISMREQEIHGKRG